MILGVVYPRDLGMGHSQLCKPEKGRHTSPQLKQFGHLWNVNSQGLSGFAVSNQPLLATTTKIAITKFDMVIIKYQHENAVLLVITGRAQRY